MEPLNAGETNGTARGYWVPAVAGTTPGPVKTSDLGVTVKHYGNTFLIGLRLKRIFTWISSYNI